MSVSRLVLGIATLIALPIIWPGTGASRPVRAFGASPPASEPPLRNLESVADVVADLEAYIPTQMEQEGVPGLAIALIRDGAIAWADGFGVANTLTGEPVTADTVFEVASISKVVTAYTALRLVEQGLLSLDEPVVTYLSEPWLPPSEYGEHITLRHLASHSSGLSDRQLPLDKSIRFPPGSDFLYSGVGALYMQEAIEQVTGQSLDEVADAVVLEPLGMTSSGFVNSAALMPRMAHGHIDYRFPVLVFAAPFAVLSMALGLIGLSIRRLRSGRWRPTPRMMVGALGSAGCLTLVGFWLFLGRDLPNLVVLVAALGIVFALTLGLVARIGRLLLTRMPAALQGGRIQGLLRVTWLGLGLVMLLWLAGMMTGPLPAFLSPRPSAIGSLRTSATDLATFVIELAEPQNLSPDLAVQVRTPQVSAGRTMSWGLGPGIQHGEQGETLWQNGQTPGFRSLMVLYPEQRMGVVVLTNGDRGFPLACDVTERALGGSAISAIVAWLG